jgi:hypothetical protein
VSVDQAGLLLWSAEAPPVAELQARGAHVVEWRRWRSDAGPWLRSSSRDRRSIHPPARERLDALLTHEAVAVLGVRLTSPNRQGRQRSTTGTQLQVISRRA